MFGAEKGESLRPGERVTMMAMLSMDAEMIEQQKMKTRKVSCCHNCVLDKKAERALREQRQVTL